MDAVEVVRAAITTATGVRTARVLQAGFAMDPAPRVPLVHVSLIQSTRTEIERVDTLSVDVYALTPTGPDVAGATALAERMAGAFLVRPVVGGGGWVDEVVVDSLSGVRPFFQDVEVVSMTLDVTSRPINYEGMVS
ncbi:hypothetical protein [uncultured Actinomyces sp.]|uniref:hypothetical protein n=1 Tax=uncultured Actinomyces sp. TaxID=249061 RepID=UPI0028EBBB55|nr:hypothetical protein [uncultured Actinomyces sp.]